jgi:demethylmenaquinone methyltransferase/2-methoxy-6-polyprenyl-1,4-benzoquinol methylase
MRVLDVATGTGLLVQAALEIGCDPQDLVGLDPSRGMLSLHAARDRVRLVQGRGESLPFGDEQFDLVMMGYALRHVDDLLVLFAELRRVLRTGGRVLVLEISKPRSGMLAAMMAFHFKHIVPHLLRGERRAMSAKLMEFYWETIEHCVPAASITEALCQTGFSAVRGQQTGPVLTDYIGERG